MCINCCNEQIQGAGSLNEGSSTDSRQWTDNNAAYSRSGSIAEDTKFDGSSSNDEKYDLQKSDSGDNPDIGQRGWGS